MLRRRALCLGGVPAPLARVWGAYPPPLPFAGQSPRHSLRSRASRGGAVPLVLAPLARALRALVILSIGLSLVPGCHRDAKAPRPSKEELARLRAEVEKRIAERQRVRSPKKEPI